MIERVDMTRVVHCRDGPYDMMIDRTSKYGNPFRVGEQHPVTGIPMSLAGCLALFRACLFELDCPVKRYQRLFDRMRETIEDIRDKRLACWCKPKACHGDILVEYLRSRDRDREQISVG